MNPVSENHPNRKQNDYFNVGVGDKPTNMQQLFNAVKPTYRAFTAGAVGTPTPTDVLVNSNYQR